MKHYFLLLLLLSLSTSCVTNKVFNALENKYATTKMAYNVLEAQNDSLFQASDYLKMQLAEKQQLLTITTDSLATTKKELNALKSDYATLESNSDAALKARIAENQELLAQIAEKEGLLFQREERLTRLEERIAANEQAMNALKQSLSDALLNFEGKGLKVEQRNGKVYVSMENKLLFDSGSWTVAAQGREALTQLAGVLEQNPDINVLIEGHTDNVPYSGKGPLKGNWDLSTKRATSIVNLLLENKEVLPQNLTAAGRGEFLPVGPNSSPAGRAANRRIEVILSPKLDEITQLLKTTTE
jgi:chemotaxis protein MotB